MAVLPSVLAILAVTLAFSNGARWNGLYDSDADHDTKTFSPSERAIIRQIVRQRQIFYPGYSGVYGSPIVPFYDTDADADADLDSDVNAEVMDGADILPIAEPDLMPIAILEPEDMIPIDLQPMMVENNDTDATPEDRAYFRRGFLRRHIYYPRRRFYLDGDQDPNSSTSEETATVEPEQEITQEVTLRLPKHVLKHLIRRYSQTAEHELTEVPETEIEEKQRGSHRRRRARISRLVRRLMRQLSKTDVKDTDTTVVNA